ncbi:MAG: ubiquinol-cytochrome C chaperone family protein [Rhizobiaceae bacterium]
MRFLSGFIAMFKALFGRNVNRDLAQALYGAVVARARNRHFYVEFQVPDTFDGRFEMLVMHLFLIHNRLKDEAQEHRKISQLVFDAFIDDMDAALREAGVGDQTVPKRIKKMTQVFYGRTGAYETALAEENVAQALSPVIARNLFPEIDSGGAEVALADYMAGQAAVLVDLPAEAITHRTEIFRGDPLLETVNDA